MKALLYRIILDEVVHISDKLVHTRSIILTLSKLQPYGQCSTWFYTLATYADSSATSACAVTAASTGIKKPGVSCGNACIEL